MFEDNEPCEAKGEAMLKVFRDSILHVLFDTLPRDGVPPNTGHHRQSST
jgi:hypothetical protein